MNGPEKKLYRIQLLSQAPPNPKPNRFSQASEKGAPTSSHSFPRLISFQPSISQEGENIVSGLGGESTTSTHLTAPSPTPKKYRPLQRLLSAPLPKYPKRPDGEGPNQRALLKAFGFLGIEAVWMDSLMRNPCYKSPHVPTRTASYHTWGLAVPHGQPSMEPSRALPDKGPKLSSTPAVFGTSR